MMEAATGAEGAGNLTANMLTFLLPILILGLMYLLMVRPQKKKEKDTTSMRNSIEVGDEITTIGGIVGRVINIKDDFITIETSADKSRVKFMRWAVQSKEEKVQA